MPNKVKRLEVHIKDKIEKLKMEYRRQKTYQKNKHAVLVLRGHELIVYEVSCVVLQNEMD